jgi:hypothetical protein
VHGKRWSLKKKNVVVVVIVVVNMLSLPIITSWVISQGILIRYVVPRIGDRISIVIAEFANFTSVAFYGFCKTLETLIPVFIFRSLALIGTFLIVLLPPPP